MKWILIAILISVIMLIARAVVEQYNEKFDFYSNLCEFLKQFKINLSFNQNKIGEFLENVKSKKQFKIFIEEYKSYLKTNNLDISKIKILDDDEKNELLSIVKNIGKYNAENEIKQVDSFLFSLEGNLEIAKRDKQKLCPMIIKLSLLFALALSIILI